MTTLLVVYCVLMRVSVGSEAWRGSEEVFERADVDGAGEASTAAGAVMTGGEMFSRGMSSSNTWSMRSPVS